MTPITSIPNVGPVTEAAFARVGVRSAEDLRALGADAAYALLLGDGARPHFIAYAVLALGLQGRPYDSMGAAEKAALRARFDALKAARAGSAAGIEADLDRLGVGPRR